MEKVIYLVWERPSVDGADLRSRLIDDCAPALARSGLERLELFIDDDLAPIPGPAPAPPDELPLRAAVCGWLPAHDRREAVEQVLHGLGVRRSGYLVTETSWCAYGDNGRTGPRDWADGERSPGITTFSLVSRNPRLDPRTFREFWYGHQSPMSEAVQPRHRYVRNTVVHPLSPGAPPFDGIVHESWPSAEIVGDPIAFHGGADDASVGEENLRVMLDSVAQLFDLERLRSVAMSEYLMTGESR